MRRLSVYGALCALLGVLAFWPRWEPPSASPRRTIPWAELERLRPGVGDLELRRAGDRWSLWPGGEPVNPYLIGELAEALAAPLSLELAEATPDAAALEGYGLAEAALRVEWAGHGRIQRLRVGRSLNRRQSFVQIEGEPEVRLAPLNLRRLLGREPLAWRDRRLFPNPSGQPTLELERRDGARLAWRIRRAAGGTWRFTAPAPWLGSQEMVERTLAAFGQARAARFADAKTAASFRAVSTFRATDAAGQRWTLELGGPGPDGRWARRAQGPVVLLPTSALGLIDLPAGALRERRLWHLVSGRVVEWELRWPARPPQHVRLEHGAWRRVGGGGEALDGAAVRRWLGSIQNLRAAGFPAGVELGPLAGVLRLRAEGDRWHELSLGAAHPSGGRLARLGSRPDELMLLSASTIEALKADP